MKKIGVPPEQFNRSLQLDGYTCGAHSVRMVLAHFGIEKTIRELKYCLRMEKKDGVGSGAVITCLRTLGLEAAFEKKASFSDMQLELTAGRLLMAVTEDKEHFMVVHGARLGFTGRIAELYIADPSLLLSPKRIVSRREFKGRWDHQYISVGRP